MSLHPTFYFAGGQINNWCEKDGTIFIVPYYWKEKKSIEPDFLTLLAIMVRKGGAGAVPRPLLHIFRRERINAVHPIRFILVLFSGEDAVKHPYPRPKKPFTYF